MALIQGQCSIVCMIYTTTILCILYYIYVHCTGHVDLWKVVMCTDAFYLS